MTYPSQTACDVMNFVVQNLNAVQFIYANSLLANKESLRVIELIEK